MKIELTVHLLTADSVVVSDLRKQFATRDTSVAILENRSATLNKFLSLMNWSYGTLRTELKSARATIDGGESVIRDFLDRICKSYSLSVVPQATGYHDRLNAVFADAQLKAGILAGFP